MRLQASPRRSGMARCRPNGWRVTATPESPLKHRRSLRFPYAEPELRDRVCTFTGHYERARFADSVPDAECLKELLDEIETTLRK